MSSKRHIIFTISDILSFAEDRERLVNELKSPKIDWEKFVKIGSEHLVLPVLYCRLKQKEILKYLPEDLIQYLYELFEINRNRNKTIIKEAMEIGELFSNNKIDYVFLKGTAMLFGDYYNDIAERMIGDIDLLVAKSNLKKAQNILLEHGYKSIKPTLNSTYFNQKHLPRLISESKIAAVEIHEYLFNFKSDKFLNTMDLLENKVKKNSIYIPEARDHLKHNIYNYQINDHGNYYQNPNLRSYYDSIAINKEARVNNQFNINRLTGNYFKIGTLFFNDFDTPLNSKIPKNLWLKTRIKYIWIQKLWMLTLRSWKYLGTLLNRLKYFIINKNYRKDLIKRCFRSNNH